MPADGNDSQASMRAWAEDWRICMLRVWAVEGEVFSLGPKPYIPYNPIKPIYPDTLHDLCNPYIAQGRVPMIINLLLIGSDMR